MKVIATIQSTMTPGAEPVDMRYYTGDNLATAISAMVSAAAGYDDDPEYTRTLAVRIEF